MKLFPFFKRNGLLIWPVNIFGWLLVLTTLVYSVYVFFDIDKSSHSVSDTLINFLFNLFLNCAVLYVVAFFTSKNIRS